MAKQSTLAASASAHNDEDFASTYGEIQVFQDDPLAVS